PDLEYEAFYMLKESDVGYDGTWKAVNVALKDFDRNGGGWNGTAMQFDQLMDSTRVSKLKILIASTAGVGKVVYLDNIWTGHPVIDVIAPDAPTGVAGTPGDYYNLVIWQDVPGESGEVYDVYASKKPITDIHSPDVDVVARGVNEDVRTAIHWLYYPLNDHDVTYYYAVQCRDAAGNIGPIAVSAQPAVNTAKGLATISLNPPAGFAADGDFKEWENSGIKPFVLKPSTTHIGAGSFTDDNDLTATVYIAADATYLYFAVDAIDDVFSFDPAGNWWEDDAVELFIGLYNWRGPKHSSFERGNEPDYQLLIRVDGLYNGRNGNAMIYSPDSTNYYFEGLGVSDYAIEARIPWTKIAFDEDKVFTPVRGMRIPLDIYVHDSDQANVSDGTLSTSPYDDDNSWQSPEHWSYTWIGDTTNVATAIHEKGNGAVVTTYELGQNYPNPFNPTTTIEYSLSKSGFVALNIYNTLGQKVKSLVNKKQSAGKHFIRLSAEDLSSGIYFYQIKSGSYSQIKKMILLK
ncbi:MAG TPA: T9SS type A sorting domain-containing protein, partial [Bacteroidetes bacterium]|nr:T9SS type A sorting domain-containing protein [Bacteroidota bacterium]